MNTNLSSFTDGFNSSDFDENIPYRNKTQQKEQSLEAFNEPQNKDNQKRSKHADRISYNENHFIDKVGNAIFDLSDIDVKTEPKSQVKTDQSNNLNSKKKVKESSGFGNK